MTETSSTKKLLVVGVCLLIGVAMVSIVTRRAFQPKNKPPKRIPQASLPDTATDLKFVGATVIRQPVNQKYTESFLGGKQLIGSEFDTSTIKFRVKNSSNERVHIVAAEFLVDTVENPAGNSELKSASAPIELISRKNQGWVPVRDPKDGEPMRQLFGMFVEPLSEKGFTFWYILEENYPADLLFLNGRLRVHVGNKFTTSELVKLEIHKEASRGHKAIFRPDFKDRPKRK